MKTDVSVHLNRKAIEKRIQDLKSKVEGDLALTDLLDAAFMVEHTTFPAILAMVDASPLAGTPVEQLKEAMQRPEWSEFVNANTRFPNWQTMLITAGNEVMKRRLSSSSVESRGS